MVGFKNPGMERRDAAIQRFEYTYEACWKAIQRYLADHEGLAMASPKGCIRSSREYGLLTAKEAVMALKMADDRNLTAHTYNAALAKRIYSRLGQYANLMDKWLSAAERRHRS